MILNIFRKHNEDFRQRVGFGRSIQTYHRYEIVYAHLRSFIHSRYHQEDIPLKDVSINLITAFEYYLRAERGLKNNSVWVYMITFKHIVSLARAEGLIINDPFASYKNRFHQIERGYLTEEDLQRILCYKPEVKMESLVRDLFLFAVFTGLSYMDVKMLRWENIRVLFDGQTWIVTSRRKTRTTSRLLLLDIPQSIIDKRGDRKTQFVFCVPSNNTCNKYLLEIGRKCAISPRLTFHIARHTFATLSLSKGVPIETLSSVLGHTSIRTTQIYAKITNKKISEDMSALAERLSGMRYEDEGCL